MAPRPLHLIAIRYSAGFAARPRPGVQERGDHGAPWQRHGAPASGRPAQPRLGRPRGPDGPAIMTADHAGAGITRPAPGDATTSAGSRITGCCCRT